MKHVHSFTGENRLIFLDNVRFLMIFFVVVLHCAASYGINEWWYVYDPKECRLIFSYVMFFVDTFAMPMLFFIAGYFALPKIEQKGTFGFIESKFVRLGIPWLICIVFIAPIIDFINHHTHGYTYSSLNYGQFWLEWLKRAIDFQFGFLTATEQFNQFVYWFISLLLFFFIVFALICALKKKIAPLVPFFQEKYHSDRTMLWVMVFAGLLSVIASLIITTIPYPCPYPWVLVGNVLQFQLWRLPVYVIFFALGVWAYGRGWFVRTNFPGPPFFWLSLCVVFSVCYVIFTNYYLANISDTRLFLVFIILVSFARVIFLIVFTSFALNYWNRPHQLSHALSANSYDIYLVHIPIVLIFQLLLTELTDVSSFIKFGIVLFFSFALSYAIGKYITNRSPLLSVFCLFMIFVLMVIFL